MKGQTRHFWDTYFANEYMEFKYQDWMHLNCKCRLDFGKSAAGGSDARTQVCLNFLGHMERA